MSLLHKIKNGKKNVKTIEFPGSTTKVALVILSSNELTEAKVAADAYIAEKKITGDTYVDMAFQQEIVFRALREIGNTDNKLAEDISEIRELEVNELAYLQVQYNLFQSENSPFLSSVTEEQFEALKKTFAIMNWSDLNGESLVALRSFLLSLV
jgi:hypothetical protein